MSIVAGPIAVCGRCTATITGDGMTTAFTITHPLGIQAAVAAVTDSNGNVSLTGCQVVDYETVIVTFAAPPAAGITYTVSLLG